MFSKRLTMAVANRPTTVGIAASRGLPPYLMLYRYGRRESPARLLQRLSPEVPETRTRVYVVD